MGACAWVLGRSGRLLSQDGGVVADGEAAVGRGAGDAKVFEATQSWRGWRAELENPTPIKYLPPQAHACARGSDQHAAI